MDIGKLLITIGSVTVIAGIVITYMPNFFSWFGKLPLDINIQTEHTRVFIPIQIFSIPCSTGDKVIGITCSL